MIISNMLPGFPVNDMPDIHLTHVESVTKSSLRHTINAELSDLQYVRFGEFDSIDQFTPSIAASRHGIMDVIEGGAQAQVSGLDTYSPVARMHDVHPVRRTMKDVMRHDVCSDVPPLPIKSSVSVRVQSSLPVPTSGFGDRIITHYPKETICFGKPSGPDYLQRSSWFSVGLPPVVVTRAPSSGHKLSVTSVNRTDLHLSMISDRHPDLKSI